LKSSMTTLKEGLAAHGELLHDTMMNVQAAYLVCKDAAVFVRFTTQDKYSSKWEQGATMTLHDYMDSALTKYKTLKEIKGQWEAPSPEQEQIIALTAAVLSLKTKTGKAPTTSKTSEGGRKKDLASIGKGVRRYPRRRW
jgi:hypothetical protein